MKARSQQAVVARLMEDSRRHTARLSTVHMGWEFGGASAIPPLPHAGSKEVG